MKLSVVSDTSEFGEQSKPKIAFLNRCNCPDKEATGHLLEHLTTHLVESYDVTVVTGQPNLSQRAEEFPALAN